MGKTDSIENQSDAQPRETATPPGVDAAAQAQLSFFDTVTSPTMTTENPAPADTEQVQTAAPESAEPLQVEASDAADASDASDELVEHAADAHEALPEGSDDAVEMRIPASESLGQRLRAAREARGMRCEEAAQAMRLPLTTVQALEADRYERIGEGIYLRSYLQKYLRLLDLPQVLAERVLTQHSEPPALVMSGTISRPRYLFERYSSSALYLILTAVIIVPAVWLAMRAGFENNISQITPLDSGDSTQLALPAAAASGAASSATATQKNDDATSAQHLDEPPLVASLAPFPTLKHDAEPEAVSKPAMPALPGEHTLRISLAEASWVEIVAADGDKLEYGLLPAGTTRNYHSAKAIDVRLGNCNGAAVEIDGKAQDLAPFRHANVAHFKLANGESAISHSGG